MYSKEQVMENATRYFAAEALPASVWTDKYALKTKDGALVEAAPSVMHERLAGEFARIDADLYNAVRYGDSTFKDTYIDALSDFSRIVLQGSPMAAIGNTYQLMSASNCVVVESPHDSIAGIMKAGTELAQLMKRRCGVGIDISTLRPDGMSVNNAAMTTSGAWSFADFFSYVTRMIGQNSRRGALMVTIDVHHPDVVKFARMKSDLKKVTGANVSIRLSNNFMAAVEADATYEQYWPPEGPKTVSKMVQAREVWDVLIDQATRFAEPGLIYWDTMTSFLPAHSYKRFATVSTNPCSEIALSPYDSCRLISLNLTGYVKGAFTSPTFDFDLFKKDIRLAARMADNLVDLELELIRRIQATCDGDDEKNLWQKLYEAGRDGRRVGLGTHGLADMLAQLCIKYDSEEALSFVDKLYSTLLFEAYNTSVDLSIERGPFPEWSWEVEKDNAFIQNLPAELKARIQKHGRRNIAMLTQAPTGSISIISKCGEFDRFNVSSGVEPVFRNFYIRRKKINSNQGGRVDFVDALGDQWQEYPVFHPNVKNYFEKVHGLKLNVPDDQMTQEQIKELLDIKLPSYFVTSDQIDWTYRVKLQGVEQRHIDHSISSCITAGHRINTDAGLKLIEDIVPKDLPPKTFTKPADDLYVVNHEGRRVKIDEVYNNGLAECVKVSFGAGLSITCTKNHKLLTLNKEYQQEWIEAGDLTKDHYIICRTGLECFGDCQKYISSIMGKFSSPLLQMRGGTKAVSIPKRMSCELSRLIGYIMSDGYVGENGVGLTQVQNNVVDDFVRLVKNIFGVNSAIIKDARSENLVNVRVNSRIIRDYFEYLGLTRDHSTIRVPRAIFECAGRQQVAEFIRGITLDGHVAGDQIIVHTTVSKLFAHDTVSLLNQFGIASNIAIRPAGERMFPGRKTYKTKESYVVYCGRESGSKFLEYIGFAEDRKTLEAKTKFRHASRKTSLGSVPDFGIRAAVRKNLLPQVKSDRLYNIVHSATSKWKNKFDLSRETLKLFCDIGFRLPNNILLNDTYVFRKPTKIENVGVLQTYDLHVKDGNSYVVNDIVSHNTTNLPKGTTSDTVGQIYLEGWKAGLKGITVYVDGSRDGVLITESAPKQKPKDGAAKRHKSLNAEVHTATVGGNKWVVLVGLMDGAPYEVFTGLASHFNLDTKPDSASIVKLSKGRYDLEIQSGKDKVVFPNIIESFNNPQGAWATRLVSLSLRHNVPLEYIVDSLSKDGKLNDINRVLARVLKKYMADGKKVTLSKTCTNCNSSNLLYQEGCPKCLDCGYTKCN